MSAGVIAASYVATSAVVPWVDAIAATGTPLAWYRLAEPSQSLWQDSSPHGHHMTNRTGTGFTYNQASLIVGDANTCISCTGTSLEQKTNPPATPVNTIEAVVKTTGTAKRYVASIATGAGDSAPSLQLGIAATTGRAFAEVKDSTGIRTLTGPSTAVNDNAAHHICATKDTTTSTLALYVDGVSQGTLTYGTPAWTVTGWYLVHNPAAGNNYSGLVDEILFWDRALSAAEILAHSNASKGI